MPAVAGEPESTGLRSYKWNNRKQVGNIGIFFGNWGQRNTHMQGGVQGNIDAQIKKNPCTILGLSECEAETEQLLKASAVADDRPWEETETLEDRPAFQYYTIRGDEKVSCLLGCRTTQCAGLESLSWLRREEGTYKSKGPSKNNMRAYTRLLVARVTLKSNVGGLGKELRVAVCHLHFQVANNNKGFKKQHNSFWPILAQQMTFYDVHVLMGDFNMSLFRVVPELRCYGFQPTLVSWFPWKTEDTGEFMADSCGIFTLMPAVTEPSVQADIWCHGVFSVLPQFQKYAGPGQTIQRYLPRKGDGPKKVKDSVEPLPMTIEEEDETEPPAVAAGKKKLMKWKGKTLLMKDWMYKGQNHKGTHFPLVCYTKNEGRRTKEAFCQRERNRRLKRGNRRPQ